MRRITSRNQEIRTVIDVGASDGRWTAQTLDYFPEANYLLVEANPVHLDALKAFCASRPNVSFELTAASDKDGHVNFDGRDPFGGTAEPTDSEGAIQTRAARLDSLVDRAEHLQGPYLLKLDTHGYEVPILEGATTILANAGLVVIETYIFRLSEEALLFDEMVALMRSKGFGVVDMSDPLWRPSDQCFWQMDLYFQPLSATVFQSNGYP